MPSETRCEMCGTVIEADSPGVVRAVEQVAIGPSRVVDGSEVLFHIGCYPANHPGYRRVTTRDAGLVHLRAAGHHD